MPNRVSPAELDTIKGHSYAIHQAMVRRVAKPLAPACPALLGHWHENFRVPRPSAPVPTNHSRVPSGAEGPLGTCPCTFNRKPEFIEQPLNLSKSISAHLLIPNFEPTACASEAAQIAEATPRPIRNRSTRGNVLGVRETAGDMLNLHCIPRAATRLSGGRENRRSSGQEALATDGGII